MKTSKKTAKAKTTKKTDHIAVARASIKDRDSKFINIGGLYLARCAPDGDGEPTFVMELSTEDLAMLLVGLSEILPDDLKLTEPLGGDIDVETIGRAYALGDSVRELLMRVQQSQHNHIWHCLLTGLDDKATPAELAMTAYGDEVAGERPDEVAAVAASPAQRTIMDDPDDDGELPGVTIGPDGVTAPRCGVIIDT